MPYAAGTDLEGTEIHEQMRTLECNKKYLKLQSPLLTCLKRSRTMVRCIISSFFMLIYQKNNDIIEKNIREEG